MEDYRQRLQTSFIVLSVTERSVFIKLAHKMSIGDWHILQLGYDLWLFVAD